MKEEEEDRALLSSLGVTSANPEEIEHDILEEARNQVEGTTDDEHLERRKTNEPSSTTRTDVINKLKAINVEIDAVACTVEDVKNFSRTEEHTHSDDNDNENGEKSIMQGSSNDLNLQHALATDRLESLKRTKAQLEKQIEHLGNESNKGISVNNKHEKLLKSLVQEEPNHKRKQKEAESKNKKQKKKHKTVAFNDDDDFDAVLNAASAGFVETERDELVRKGILTPFHNLKGYERRIEEDNHNNNDNDNDLPSTSIARAVKSISEAAKARPTTKLLDPESLPRLDPPTRPFQKLKTPFKNPNNEEGKRKKDLNGKKRRPLPGKRWRKAASREDNEEIDDTRDSSIEEEEDNQENDDGEDEDNNLSFITLEGGLKIPSSIFTQLFDYQKVGVQWLWELHCQKAGGIIGDEMGLGKTIQVLSFLASLHFSNLYKPSIIICPVTLLRQWKRESKKWYPTFHTEILHDSALEPSRKKPKKSDSNSDNETTESDNEEEGRAKSVKVSKGKKWDGLINRVLGSESGLLITTYEQLRILGEKLLDVEWGYAVLDEGHRIRNPNAEVTLVCKQLQTVHRVIMTGAPIQNRLSELWSLFDFVFPGKLGVLPVFEAEFAVPISVGGYANASPLQVSTAYRCAVVLRDLIMPYLLRRMKSDVNAYLPNKTEHVLFCSLTQTQRQLYRAFLASSDVEQIFNGDRNSLYGIDIMRKICNHPDLLERAHAAHNPDYGNPERSGKMKIVANVLKVWKQQGHRVLLFAQTQQMVDILEGFLVAEGYCYRRMDGMTPVRQRMTLMDEFNGCEEIFVFVLTTKVGGLGTNLTGANRVIIFDPDWNPSTDMQARERAWRIGQTKDVTVYRLITRGTIEEKVYHRQIYKHFLTNKILKNPQQKRFFKARDMKDLFTLNDDDDKQNGTTETSNLFSQISEDVNIVKNENTPETSTKKKSKNKEKEKEKEKIDDDNNGGGGVEDETNILRSLFDAQGIHSAVNHDVIMNANDSEKVRIDEHASQVAQRAAEALRQSRMLRSCESIAVPTWTGRSGTAGAPGRKFGSTVNSKITAKTTKPEEASASGSGSSAFQVGALGGKALTSSELLAKIRGTREQAVSDATGGGAPRLGGAVQPEVLIRQICSFLQERDGVSDSGSIVEYFKHRIPSKDLPVFKSLLKEIATLQKNPNGSSWTLKPEYQ